MLIFCIKCQEIFGCVEEDGTKKECYQCQGNENCPLNILYPKQDIAVGICYHCSKEIIWATHRKRRENRG